MAAAWRKVFRSTNTIKLLVQRGYHQEIVPKRRYLIPTICGVMGGTFTAWYVVKNVRKSEPSTGVVHAKDPSVVRGERKRAAMQTQRELRFLSFASVEYEGSVFMTPQDFLESVTEEAPRPRTGRIRATKDEVQKLLKYTPQRWKGSSKMFRNLHDQGLISYTEYLFLICVLTKPHSGFRIAFNMFDTDGNQRVDKKEFLVLVAIYYDQFSDEDKNKTAIVQQPQSSNLWNLIRRTTLEQIIPGSPSHQKVTLPHQLSRPMLNGGSDGGVITDTTLMVHFFGQRGRDVLTYEDFHRFMDNLQTEVLELEFTEFSKGMSTITEEEFARILLRYTILKGDEIQDYLNRLRQRIPDVKGISFKDFKEFCQFLNNLEDFSIAMKMYTFTDLPISEEEFARAVKACTGQTLEPHLVHVVFQLFDIDGDNHLSHKEFISVMKDRLHRGFRTQTVTSGSWDAFKGCMKNQMKRNG